MIFSTPRLIARHFKPGDLVAFVAMRNDPDVSRSQSWDGYAAEAVRALVDHAFPAYGLHRITASADPRNTASCRVLEKAGFRKEAHFRQSEWFKGEWADDAVYARLATDV